MTLANAMVLHKHFLEIGRLVEAAQLVKRYPELASKPKEVKKDGKVSKR